MVATLQNTTVAPSRRCLSADWAITVRNPVHFFGPIRFDSNSVSAGFVVHLHPKKDLR